tara:strand:- start:873 stop:1622 length:750 start_codon:yes stop_codon:yes gene_type:complete
VRAKRTALAFLEKVPLRARVSAQQMLSPILSVTLTMTLLRPHIITPTHIGTKMNKQETSTNSDKFANIWITSKIRMETHARYKRLDLLSHLVLTTYSVILLGFAVFSPRMVDTFIGNYQSELSIFFSLSVLCASLVIWGLKFGQLANEHQECYHKLHNLYNSDILANEKTEQYHQILERYPNHSVRDAERMLYNKIIINKENLSRSDGTITFGYLRIAQYHLNSAINLLLMLLVMFAPLIPLGILYAIN